MRPNPDANVTDWVSHQPSSSLYFSAVSEAEMRYGAEKLPEGRRRDRLLAEIEQMLQEDFSGRILPFDSNAARAYARIAAARRAAGRPISHADCQIAAIARSIGASVATRDVTGFEGCGIEIINPWDNP